MVWLRRIGFFLVLNVTVVMTISVITSLLGLGPTITASGMNYASLITFCLLYGFVGSFISLLLSKPMAKWSLGVQVIDPKTIDSQERALLDTVYRLARGAGIEKMPEVGVYDSPEVNAFATGATKNRSLVAVSSGLLRALDRSSVEGVLGHEVSHIANGDMVTMALLQGVVNAFVMALARIIAFAIDSALRSNDRDSRDSLSLGGLGGFAYYGIVMLLEMVLFIPGSMVIAAFSRFREFRADAGGARLAGKQNMVGALRGLQRLQQVNDQVPAQPAYAAFKIARTGRVANLFSSHPPLDVRIARLESGV
jgi:heat shock protein HtpX